MDFRHTLAPPTFCHDKRSEEPKDKAKNVGRGYSKPSLHFKNTLTLFFSFQTQGSDFDPAGGVIDQRTFPPVLAFEMRAGSCSCRRAR